VRAGYLPVTFTWYDGGKLPPGKFVESYNLTTERQVREGDRTKTLHEPGYAANGSLLVGDKGVIYLDDAYGARYRLFPRKNFEGFKPPAKVIPRSPGHMQDWVDVKNAWLDRSAHLGPGDTAAIAGGITPHTTPSIVAWVQTIERIQASNQALAFDVE